MDQAHSWPKIYFLYRFRCHRRHVRNATYQLPVDNGVNLTTLVERESDTETSWNCCCSQRRKMYKLDLPVDYKEAAAIERRRRMEEERKSRIFNAKCRTIGVRFSPRLSFPNSHIRSHIFPLHPSNVLPFQIHAQHQIYGLQL